MFLFRGVTHTTAGVMLRIRRPGRGLDLGTEKAIHLYRVINSQLSSSGSNQPQEGNTISSNTVAELSYTKVYVGVFSFLGCSLGIG